MNALRLPFRRRFGRMVAVLASAFAAVTCDLVTSPTADTGLTVEYTGPRVFTVGQTVDFDFRALEDGVLIEGARVRVVSSDPDVIEIQGNEFTPRLFVKARGQATITATLLGSTLGENPPFVAVPITGVVKSVTIDSAAVTFRSLSDTLRLHADASDFNDQLISGAGAGARWSSSDAAIVQVDSVSGRIVARGNGTARVIARLDSTADTTTVLVQQRLVRFAFTPVNLVLNALNLDTVVTVTPLDSGGTALATGAPAFTTTMTALNAGIASVVRLTNTTFRVSSQGNAATATGIRVVDATGNVADDTLSVSVGQVAQSMVITTAASDTIDAFQDTVRVRARAFDARNVEVQSRPITWTSANTSLATVDQTGLVTGQTAGSVQVQAKMDAATASATIIVRNTARTVVLSLDSARMTTIGDTLVLAATARNRLGATVAGIGVTWQSLDTLVARVTGAGAVIATGVGNSRVIATIAGGYADTTFVRVTNDPASVNIVPTAVTLASVGDSAAPAVDIRNARGAALGRTAVTWRSADTTATVTATGIIIARAAGATFVTATTPDSARADTVLVTVTNAPETVTLNRVLDTLTAPTRTLQYDAVIRNGRSNVIAGAPVNWRSSNASVASVNAAGLVTALAVGQTLVIGEATSPGAGGQTAADTARLVVTNDVVSLTVSPTNITVPSVGATATITADPRNAVGATVTGVTPIWSTSDANVATVSTTGVVTGIAVGTATITGNVAGRTASAGVTVTNAPDTINILPTSATLASINDSVAPPVAFRNALGAALPRGAAQWSSLDGAIAQVTPDGIIIATGRGTTLVSAINALNPARRDSITVTVTNAPAAIDVGRTLDSLPSLNRTIQYSADVFNARGNLIVGQAIAWTSRTGSVATISSTGIATSVGIGSTWIVGTAGTVSDSARLVVSNFANTVVLTPAAIDLTAIGQTAALTAVARNELGNVIASPAVLWASANTAVATVSGTGVVTAVATGSTTVSATVDGVTASVPVTVTNPPTILQITSGNLTLASIGDQVTPSVNFRNALNAVLARDAALWTSSNVNIATVSSTGVVTAVAAGAATITATSPANATLSSSITVTVTNAPATLTVAPAGTTTLTAIGATVAMTATVRNAAGAVIAAPSPAVTWSSNSAAVTVNPATGVATAVTPSAGATITATAGVATGNATVAVAPVASGARSTIASSAANITANGVATATITVQLKDANGVNLTTSGGTVTMTLTGTGTLGTVTNVGNGTYTATLTAPTALGSGSVSAAINGTAITTGDPLVNFVAGAASKYIVTTSSTTPAAGSSVTITAQQADAFNNPVTTAATVTWSSTGGGSFSAPTTAVNASGIATVTFTTSTAAVTTHNVTATTGGVTGVSPAIQTVAGVATNYLVIPATTSPAAGAGVTITAQLRDANLNPISQAGTTVTWTKSNINGAFSAPTSVTNASGVATITLTTHTVAGTATTVTATTGGVAGTSGTITTVPGAPSTATTTITSSTGTVTAGGAAATLTVQLRDANSNVLTTSPATVLLSATTGTLGGVVNNGNGTYTATFTGGAGSSATISGTLDGANITDTEVIAVTAGAASAAQTTAVVPSGSAGAVTTITVQARDAFGNNRTTASGTVAATITGANNASGTVTGGTTGVYTVTYTPTTAGADAVAITLDGTPIGGSPYTSVVATGGLNNFLVEQTGGGNIGTQTAGFAFNIRITARDISGNTVTGFGGTVALSSAGCTIPGAPVTSGAFTNGVLASQAVTITTTGSCTITATSVQSGTSNSFTVNPGALDHFAVTSTGGGAIGTQTAATAFSILITAQDANDNTVTSFSGPSSGGHKVVLTSTGTMTGEPITTANFASGTHTQSVTITNTGSFTITATRDGGTENGTSGPFSVIASAAQTTMSVPPGTAAAPTSITIQTKDANGVNLTASSGNIVVAAVPLGYPNTGATFIVTDNTDGTYTATYTPTVVGLDNIEVTLGGTAISGSPGFSMVGASPVQTTATVPDGTAGSATTITIVTRDANGVPVTGSSGGFAINVSVAGTNAGAAVTVVDNLDGTYTATYTPGLAGTDTITILLLATPITGSPFTSTVN